MKLKKRLTIAFFIVIIIPIILVAAIGSAIINHQSNLVQQLYDVETHTLQIISNPIQILNRVTRGVYNQIKLAALKEPERFEDEDYIKQLNDDLVGRYSFIVLRKDKNYIFSGNKLKLKKIEPGLPRFGIYSTEVDGGLYIGGENPCLVKQQDFYFKDGGEGSIFVITDVNTMVPQLKSSAIQFAMAFILIMCFTASTLTFWIYRSILRPLNTLRIATNNMKEGNLNFSIRSESRDEIGQLCEDFEEMRIRLKELIEVRMQYEVETKELISNISHDLKTPLTAIKGYAEGILDGVADSEDKMDKYLKTIYTKANDMTFLVDELSFYTKIDCNTMPYTFTNINLNQYFNDCIEDLSLDLELKNIEISYFNYTDHSVFVVADIEQLKRVINNIISNCVKYIGKSRGVINVRIKELEDDVQIEFEDNGKGIAQKDLPYIFQRFYRTDTSRNSSKGGSGLGLAIAKKIIEEHGGSIWATSKENVGTILYFTLKKIAYKEDL